MFAPNEKKKKKKKKKKIDLLASVIADVYCLSKACALTVEYHFISYWCTYFI